MRLRSNSGWRAWVAFVATYALALQLVFGNPMPGHAADLPQILCAGGAAQDHAPAPPHHLPDCCQHGCCTLASLWVALPPAAPPPPGARWLSDVPGRPGLAVPRRLDGDPRLTRGPPPVA